MFYAQSTEKGETKCIPTTSKNSDSLFKTNSTVEDNRISEKMKLNELGGQKEIIIIIIIIITILIWRPSWSSDHSRRTLMHVNFFTLTVTFEHRTHIVAD